MSDNSSDNSEPKQQQHNAQLAFPVEEEEATRLVKGERQVETLAYAFIERATKSYIRGLADNRIPKDTGPALEFTKRLMEQNPAFKLQLVADVQRENLEYYKALVGAGVEVRHAEGNKISFAISKDEYLAAPLAAIEEQTTNGAAVPAEIIWSNRQDVVSQFEQIFQVMWQNSIKAEARLKELEDGVEPEETVVIEDMERVYAIGRRMNDECKEEALMMVASDKTILRNEALFRSLAKRQREVGFPVRILIPRITQEVQEILPDAEWKETGEKPINVTILIYDRKRMFLTQYSNREANTTEQAVSANIYSTSRATIASIAYVFQSLWDETDLRQREERSRKQAQLLQDVLTHDIRNFNQVSKTGSELLLERLRGDPEYQSIARSILEAIDGSSELVDKAKKLGKILAEEQGNIKLQGTDLIHSIDKALLLVKRMYPNKQIKETRRVLVANRGDKAPPPEVLADDLLDDVFINLFSNSAKFTREDKVLIDILIEEQSEKRRKRSQKEIEQQESYWRVTVRDSGPGIAAEHKEDIFERYSKGKKGSGLGLSIVHAIVVGRYGGQIRVVEDEQQENSLGYRRYTGAIFSLMLKNAAPSIVDQPTRITTTEY